MSGEPGSIGLQAFEGRRWGEAYEALKAALRRLQGTQIETNLVTGGTDSHGPHPDRPVEIGSLDIPDWVGDQFLSRAPKGWAESR